MQEDYATIDEVRRGVYDATTKIFRGDRNNLSDQTTLKDLNADSLDIVELIMEWEKTFKISIPDDDAKKIVTLGEAVNYIWNTKNPGEKK